MPEEEYPAAWEADVAVADGGVVHVRPIRPDDADRLVALHSRLSERTRYLRYFAPYPQLSERDLHHFTHVDHRDRVALVAVLGEDLIAVGRYDRITGTADAEVASDAPPPQATVIAPSSGRRSAVLRVVDMGCSLEWETGAWAWQG